MNEIRFRASEDQVEQEFRRLYKNGAFDKIDRCDTCHERYRGYYSIASLEFTCIRCWINRRFEQLAGKP